MRIGLRYERACGRRLGWAVGGALVACMVFVEGPSAQQGGAPRVRMNRIIEQFEKGLPSFGVTVVSDEGILLDNDSGNNLLRESVRGKMQSVDRGLKGESNFLVENENETGAANLIAFVQSKGALGYNANKWVLLAHANENEAMASDLREAVAAAS